MILFISLVFGFLSQISQLTVAEKATRLGCFNVTDNGVADNLTLGTSTTGQGDYLKCVVYCQERNFTFAGIKRSQLCMCGEVLGGARRVPLHECLSPCHYGQCGLEGRVLLYILGHTLDVVATSNTPASGEDLSVLNLHQAAVLGVAVTVMVLVTSLLIHCARVSRRRDRLLKLYISHLERGEAGGPRPASWITISNTLCADFICCCCARDDEDILGYEELLNELDIDPGHRQSFSRKVKEYIERCEAEKKMDKDEIRRLLRNLSKSGSQATSRSSLRQLAEHYAKARRQQKSSGVSLRGTNSSPARLCRNMTGSSVSSLERAFPEYSSNISMHLNSNVARVLKNESSGGPFANTNGNRSFGGSLLNSNGNFGGILEEEATASQCSSSQCSSNRLIPVSSHKSRPSRHKKGSVARMSRHKHVNKQTNKVQRDTETSDSESDIDTDT